MNAETVYELFFGQLCHTVERRNPTALEWKQKKILQAV